MGENYWRFRDGHLHCKTNVDQQGVVTRSWNIVPGSISKILQPSDIFVHKQNREDREIRVRLDAQDKIGFWTRREVVESSISVGVTVKLMNEAAFIKLLKLGYCPQDVAFDSLALQCVFVQIIPANRAHVVQLNQA